MKLAHWIFVVSCFIMSSAYAVNKEWVSVEVHVISHHGNNETMRLKIMKNGKTMKLIVDDFILPETRILTNKQDLEAILNFSQTAKDVPCGRDKFSYIRKIEGKSERMNGCPTSKNFQALRNSFRQISAIK